MVVRAAETVDDDLRLRPGVVRIAVLVDAEVDAILHLVGPHHADPARAERHDGRDVLDGHVRAAGQQWERRAPARIVAIGADEPDAALRHVRDPQRPGPVPGDDGRGGPARRDGDREVAIQRETSGRLVVAEPKDTARMGRPGVWPGGDDVEVIVRPQEVRVGERALIDEGAGVLPELRVVVEAEDGQSIGGRLDQPGPPRTVGVPQLGLGLRGRGGRHDGRLEDEAPIGRPHGRGRCGGRAGRPGRGRCGAIRGLGRGAVQGDDRPDRHGKARHDGHEDQQPATGAVRGSTLRE